MQRLADFIPDVQLVLASRNRHKLEELSVLLAPNELAPLGPDVRLPDETGDTFAENALAKARAAMSKTGLVALGEDSGIEVAALGRAPGVRSARYAGEQATDDENLTKLMSEMEGVEDRRAQYVSALALVTPGGEEKLFEASCVGWLAPEPRGSGGFGYDPIFVPVDGSVPGKTMAELSSSDKNAISHRGRAARLLLQWLSFAR